MSILAARLSSRTRCVSKQLRLIQTITKTKEKIKVAQEVETSDLTTSEEKKITGFETKDYRGHRIYRS